MSPWSDVFATIMADTLAKTCQDDTVRSADVTTEELFRKLNADMITAAKTIEQPTASGVMTASSNKGTGTLIFSLVDPVDGLNRYYALSETIKFICQTSSYAGSATAGVESFLAASEVGVDPASFNWPKGSSSLFTLNADYPDQTGILDDPGFETWASGICTAWNSITGSWGTTHKQIAGYKGSYALQCLGDGTANVSFSQKLDKSLMLANKSYALSFWYKTQTPTLSTAQLRVALTDTPGNILNNNNAVAQSNAFSTGTLNAATSWTQATIVFQTPRLLPDDVWIQFRFTGLLDNAKDVLFDQIGLYEQAELYSGGPFVTIASGGTAFAVNDEFKLVVTNNKTTTNFVRSLDRVFGLAEKGIRLQISGSANILDSLIS